MLLVCCLFNETLVVSMTAGFIVYCVGHATPYIKISKQEPGVEDRIITITGTPEQIQNAQFLLQMWLPSRMAMSILTPTTSTQVSVSNKMIGAIMGRSGCRINQVRHESNADIKISKQEPGVEDRIITITGTPEQIQNAQFLLQMWYVEYK
ncbi:uncharacterized protein DC041_0004127 [Schistosoma bovis]|uniref:K Homology domain-containing protein n=1 Tax=Schistosoma bovis TaxID=6184 RepID=A0A430Q8C5_SCHBO|nr:uncharacterized protein DC041_0004127 [Schistosoma bovis]